MAVLLGILVALSYGAGDFLGGLATRSLPVTTVVAASQASALVVLAVTLPLEGTPVPWSDVGLGALAGSVGVVGVLLLYQGLATGAMGVVAPVTAVGAAVVPLVVGLATGERPAPVALLGAVLALGAVALWRAGATLPTGPPAPAAARRSSWPSAPGRPSASSSCSSAPPTRRPGSGPSSAAAPPR